MQKIQTSRGSIAYEERGSGQALVLVHANAGDHHNFDSVLPALAVHFRTLAVDLPGFGESQALHSPESSTATHMADALAEFVAALGLENAVFIGNSVGGYAAARLAISAPARVRALILVDSGGFSHQTAFTRLFCRLKGSGFVPQVLDDRFTRLYLKRRNSFVDAIIACSDAYHRDPLRAAVIAALWRSFLDPQYDLRPLAGRIRVPTLLVWGRDDPVLQLADARTALGLIPGSHLVVLETGHMPFAEDPPAFLAAVTQFLAELPAPEVQIDDYAASHA